MDDTTDILDLSPWSGSRRTLLSAAAGLWLPTLLPRGSVATPVAQPATTGLRDFAYVCAALTLEAQERDDLKPVGDIRYKASELAFTPEAFVAAGYSPEQAQRLVAGGARQVCIYSAANTDESRLLVLNLVEGTTPEGADDILQLFRDILGEQNVSDLGASDVAPDADNAFLGEWHGTPSSPDSSHASYQRFCGLRFGTVVAIWQLKFRSKTPELALAAPINCVLRDYLTDEGATTRRGASLAFLLTIPRQPSVAVIQYILDGTTLGRWTMDETQVAEKQAFVASTGITNALDCFFTGPDSLHIFAEITEFASREQARDHFSSSRQWLASTDWHNAVRSRPLASDEFSLSGWDVWEADVAQDLRTFNARRNVRVQALAGPFEVYIEVGGKTPPDPATTVPARGDPALQRWSAMAQQLLAPMPAAARHPPHLAARAVFPPPLPAFSDPLMMPTAARGQALPPCSILENWLLPPLPGQLAVAQRTFTPPTDEGPGIVHFNPNVAEYATEDLAEAALPVLIDRIETRVPGVVREDIGTHILDESVLYTWEQVGDRGPVAYADVLFRDGRYIHTWNIQSMETDPVRPLLEVIRHLLARGRLPAETETPTVIPDLARLFDQLPEAQDVPRDLDLVREGCGVRREAGTNEATPISGRDGS